jgi:Na+/melibiose symporter-like transporter
VFAAALAALHVVEAGSPPLLLWGLCAVAGAGFAGTQLLPFSILTDLIHADTLRSGMRREGSFTGLFIAGEKAGLALGPLLTAGVLSLTGFVAAAEGAAVQPPAAVAGIAVAFTLVPAALAGLGAVVLLRVGR